MYGLVNKAVESMTRSQFGEERWLAVKRRAGVDADYFVAMSSYPDDLTYRLVGAASVELGLPAATILESFGRYWILYSAQEGYGEMLRMAGSTLREFLLNLDAMHARIGLSFPELRPPSFTCTDIEAAGLTLHYHSERSGLTSFVVGLLAGLGERFGTPVTVTILARKDEGADHDIFRVAYTTPSGG